MNEIELSLVGDKEIAVSDIENRGDDTPEADGQQSNEATEANKPDDARAKDEPNAGNILGGVQPKQ